MSLILDIRLHGPWGFVSTLGRIIMFRTTAALSRTVTALVTLSTGLAGAVLVTATPAQAAVSRTNFGLEGTAYGTLVEGGQLPATSGKSAFSWISCTREAGREASNHVASANLGNAVEVGAVTSANRTWKNATGVHMGSTNSIASVTIGDPSAQEGALEVKALETNAHAWHDDKGYHAKTRTTGFLVATAGTTPIQTNIEQLPVLQVPGQKFEVPLPKSGEYLTIPGVVTLTSDWTNNVTTRTFGHASVNGLRLDLEATDAMVILGRAWARVNGGVPAGVMGGRAFGSELKLLDGSVTSGQTAVKPLPCPGTGGVWKSRSSLGSTIPGTASLGVTKSQVYGKQSTNRSAIAKTRSTVAEVTLGNGQVSLNAIAAQANVNKSRTGQVTKNSNGTSPGTITLNGKTRALPLDGTYPLGDLGTIETNEVTRSKFGIKVTSVKVTLFNGTAADSVLHLGNAWTSIRPS